MKKNLYLKKFAFKSNPVLDLSNIEDLDLKYNDLSKKSDELYQLWMEDQSNRTLQKYKEVENLKRNIKSQIKEHYNLLNKYKLDKQKEKELRLKEDNLKVLEENKSNQKIKNVILGSGLTLGGIALALLLSKNKFKPEVL